MQTRSFIKRHGWFLGLLVLWLALVRYAPSLKPAPTPTMGVENLPVVASVSETPTSLPSLTSTASPAPNNTPSPLPTATTTTAPTATRTPTLTPAPTTTPSPTQPPPPTQPPQPAAPPAPIPGSDHPSIQPAVLANYFAWYDPGTWATGCTLGGDQPRAGAYNSDDPNVMARHIAQAQSAGLDGFAVHWLAPGNRTDVNLSAVLNLSPDGFNSTVMFLYHILPGANQQGVINSLRHIIESYSGHPRFFRAAGKPVIMFSDMYRVPDANGWRSSSDQDVSAAVARWAEIRQAVDPDHATWWIAEGLQAGYLAVFDGLYVYKIDHACCPSAYQGAARWAGWVRDWEQQSGQPKLWIGTVMPGWNDLNSAQAQCADLRVSSATFARERAEGAYYAKTWEAVLPTQPDFILVHSFNEWKASQILFVPHRV